MSASIFPLPTTVRDGTLPDNNFNGPGYARVDLSFSKRFPIKERVAIQARVEASNALNRSNISDVVSSLTDINFAQADSFYPMRTVQLSMKVIF
jgi:outer membrane receptor protein involved in Fe transport